MLDLCGLLRGSSGSCLRKAQARWVLILAKRVTGRFNLVMDGFCGDRLIHRLSGMTGQLIMHLVLSWTIHVRGLSEKQAQQLGRC